MSEKKSSKRLTQKEVSVTSIQLNLLETACFDQINDKNNKLH
jgi:hypothetical protein